jgi:hypothetical protein
LSLCVIPVEPLEYSFDIISAVTVYSRAVVPPELELAAVPVRSRMRAPAAPAAGRTEEEEEEDPPSVPCWCVGRP